jgi:hypothetical protein
VRSVTIVGALFYVLGFLTTNAYLYKLGVSNFSLLRTRFILTGVITLAPLALALICESTRRLMSRCTAVKVD